MNRICLLFSILLIGGIFTQNVLKAQDSSNTIEPSTPIVTPSTANEGPYSLSNPQGAIMRHLYYLQPESYEPDQAAMSLFSDGMEQEALEKFAIMLKEIYDAKGDFVHEERLPVSTEYLDSATNQHRYVVFPEKYPELVVKKYGNKWLYSRGSVSAIPVLHAQIFPFGASWLKQIPVSGKFLGLQSWQWLGTLIILGICYLLYIGFSWIFGSLLKRIIARVFPKSIFPAKLMGPVAHPLSLFLIAILMRELFMPMLLLPIRLGGFLSLVLKLVIPVLGIVTAYRLVDVVANVSKGLASRTDTTMDDQLVPLVTKMVKLIVVVFGLLILLQNLDVNVTALLAGISIGGLALALAAQETVKNFIGSVAIFIDRPFVIGDFIDTGAFTGAVVEVGVRSTRLRAPDGAMISIPNGKIADMTITNHGVRTYRRYATTLTVTYDTPPAVIEQFVEGVKAIAIAHPHSQDDSVTVNFHEMADSSLNIFFAVIYNVTGFADFIQARQEVFLEVMRLAEKLSVSFAFPSTSVYVEQMPEKSDLEK